MPHLKDVRAKFLFGLGQNGKKLIIFKNFTLVSQSWSHKTGSNIASVFLIDWKLKCCLRIQYVYLMFQWMFFSSVKEINRLITKGMSNIYLKVTIEKNWCS